MTATAALRRLLPVIVLAVLVAVGLAPASASADTGSDSVSIFQEYTTHYVGSSTNVYLGLEDDSESCFAFGNCDNPTGTVTMTLTYAGTGVVAATATGPVTPNSGSNSTSTANIVWYVGANAATYDASFAYSGDGQFAAKTITGSVTSSKIPTAVTLTQSSYQTYAGQPVTFTASIAATAGNPYEIGGTAQLWYGVNPWGAPFTVTNGVGTLSTTSLPVSDNTGRTYYVQYLGDGQHSGAESNNVDHRTLPTTATTMTLSVPTPDWTTDPVTISAHISAADGTTPSGSISYFAWGTFPFGGRYLAYSSSGFVDVHGNASVSWPAGTLSQGNYTIEAGYSANNPAFASADATAPLSVIVGSAQAGATVTASANPSPGTVGGTTTLSATVAVPGSPAATGTVRFVLDGATSLGTCTLAGSTCTVTTATPAQGTHTISARYLGDTHWQPASADTTLTVRAAAIGNIGATPRHAVSGTAVTVRAKIHTGGGAPAKGRVTFREGGGLIGGATLDATGLAHISTTLLPVGTDTILARYSGNAHTAPISLTITVTIVTS